MIEIHILDLEKYEGHEISAFKNLPAISNKRFM